MCVLRTYLVVDSNNDIDGSADLHAGGVGLDADLERRLPLLCRPAQRTATGSVHATHDQAAWHGGRIILGVGADPGVRVVAALGDVRVLVRVDILERDILKAGPA
jgi:hypothetical protein